MFLHYYFHMMHFTAELSLATSHTVGLYNYYILYINILDYNVERERCTSAS